MDVVNIPVWSQYTVTMTFFWWVVINSGRWRRISIGIDIGLDIGHDIGLDIGIDIGKLTHRVWWFRMSAIVMSQRNFDNLKTSSKTCSRTHKQSTGLHHCSGEPVVDANFEINPLPALGLLYL